MFSSLRVVARDLGEARELIGEGHINDLSSLYYRPCVSVLPVIDPIVATKHPAAALLKRYHPPPTHNHELSPTFCKITQAYVANFSLVRNIK